MALVLAAVAAAPTRSAATPPVMGDGGTVRVVDNAYSTQSYARITMQTFKLDAKYGIKLQIIPAANTQSTIVAFQSGSADIALFNWLDLARMRNAGIMATGVAPFLQFGADYWVVPANSPLKTIGDLKGHRVGIYSRTSINWVITVAAAQQVYHFDINTESQVQEAAANLLRGLLEQGQLDAAHVFNNLTPDMIVTGKFRIMSQIKDEVDALGLPSTPFLFWAASDTYAAAHPNNVMAFVEAYRDAVEILRTDDSAWVAHATELGMPEAAIPALRTEMRADTWSRFQPQNEADIRKTFDVLYAIAGPKVMGMTTLPQGFMTLKYQ
jgi:NitT/TauT family transport system substrate-binding protein